MNGFLGTLKTLDWRYWIISWGIGFSLVMWLSKYGFLASAGGVLVNFVIAMWLVKFFKK